MFANSYSVCYINISYFTFHNSSPQLEHSHQDNKYHSLYFFALLLHNVFHIGNARCTCKAVICFIHNMLPQLMDMK